MAILKPSSAPSINTSYTFTPRIYAKTGMKNIKKGIAHFET